MGALEPTFGHAQICANNEDELTLLLIVRESLKLALVFLLRVIVFGIWSSIAFEGLHEVLI